MFRVKKNIIIPVLIILLLSLSILISNAAADNLIIHFIDVGQADSIFIQLPNSQTMLIDGGNNGDGSLIINYIKGLKESNNKIDYLIGTHPHEDHIGGLDDIINEFDIGRVFLPKVSHTSKTFEDLMLAIRDNGLKISAARAGQTIFDDDNINLKAVILSPGRDSYDELNNYSVVVRLVYGDTAYLFTGDAEGLIENELLRQQLDLKANILKVAHHGSSSSTSERFLKAVVPEYAVISVGKDNSYGHPSQLVIDRLQRDNIKVYRTDRQRTIIASSDGNKIKFNKKELVMDSNALRDTGVYLSMVTLTGSVESVVISNNTADTVNLSNWKLVSEVGGQEYIFPKGTEIPAQGQLKVVSGRGAKADQAGVILWNNSYIWNNDGDPAVLYAPSGQIVSRFPREE
ncbi:MAG: MBL fold metallo-hydrolase [Firmicutes bacterium]|nr:MBL fold metallo-hydrolase [Bacillota bacterium]